MMDVDDQQLEASMFDLGPDVVGTSRPDKIEHSLGSCK